MRVTSLTLGLEVLSLISRHDVHKIMSQSEIRAEGEQHRDFVLFSLPLRSEPRLYCHPVWQVQRGFKGCVCEEHIGNNLEGKLRIAERKGRRRQRERPQTRDEAAARAAGPGDRPCCKIWVEEALEDRETGRLVRRHSG